MFLISVVYLVECFDSPVRIQPDLLVGQFSAYGNRPVYTFCIHQPVVMDFCTLKLNWSRF